MYMPLPIILLLFVLFLYPVRRAHHLCACVIHLRIWVAAGALARLCSRNAIELPMYSVRPTAL
jgi:hypothetical protein